MTPVVAALALSLGVPASGLRIHDLQGRAHRSPFAGLEVTDVEGIVTGPAPGGFFFEDDAPDDDPATSEGMRVSSSTPVSRGDRVRVAGTVREVRPGCEACAALDEAFANLTTTELAADSVLIVGRAPVPPPTRVGSKPGDRAVPAVVIEDDAAGDVEAAAGTFDPERDGLDFYESLEGMRIELTDARAVGPTLHPPGRAAEIAVVPDRGEGFGPFTSRGSLRWDGADANPERLFLTAGAGVKLPDADVGDRWRGPIVGVVDYAFGKYRVLLEGPLPELVRAGALRGSMFPPRAGEISVATFNAQNFGPATPSAKVEAVARLIVERLFSPDLLVLQEVQDDSGPADDGTVGATETYRILGEAISRAGGPPYAAFDVAPLDGEDGGQPGGNIRVAFLVRQGGPLRAVGRPAPSPVTAEVVRRVDAAPSLAYSPGRVDPANPVFANSRKPVALELEGLDAPLFLVGVHFQSRLGDPPSFGRFQPPGAPSRGRRTGQASAVARFVRGLLDADRSADVLVAGDLNDGPGTEPLAALEESGLVDLDERIPEPERYSSLHEGSAEAIDHVLASGHLARQVSSITAAHVEVDFARASSDHDPILVRWTPAALRPRPACTCRIGRRARTATGGGPLAVLAGLAVACCRRRVSSVRRGR